MRFVRTPVPHDSPTRRPLKSHNYDKDESPSPVKRNVKAGELGPYKGFNSSITSIFEDSSSARIDCCSISCCGILQYDYNRYVLHHKRPATFKNSFFQHIAVPLVFFASAGYAAVYIPNRAVNQIVCTALLFMSLFWIVGGCLQSTHKRANLRMDILKRLKYGIGFARQGDYSFDEIDVDQSEGNTFCAHRFCGIYPSDFPEEIDESENEKEVKVDFCGKLSRFYSLLCCGKIFSKQIQLCGACALSQEGRELDALVSPEKRRFDYITFQPFVDYFNGIRMLRNENNGKLLDHYAALSKLSRIILKSLAAIFIGMILYVGLLAPKHFHWSNLLVFAATFLQAFFILYFVHWHWNRLDISLDAVIKYFACGFVLTTTTAVFFELAETVLLQLTALLIMKMSPRIDNAYEYNGFGMGLSVSDFNPHSFYTAAASSSDYKKAFGRKHPVIAGIFIFFSAYFIAALVEEACKYFGFKMVEHPDFMTEEELRKAAEYGVPEGYEDEDRFEFGGGLECISGLDCIDSYDSYDACNNDDERITENKKDKEKDKEPKIDTGGESGHDRKHHDFQMKPVELVDAPPRTLQSIASSVTIAMVSVALGFACCENLIYIFLYNGSSLSLEIAVLVSRSLFPIHPLCAAIQSIGVCKRHIENDKSIGLSRILFPAIMLHGSYDFTIMMLNFVSQLTVNGNANGNTMLVCNILALVFSVSFVVAGVFYYVRNSHQQMARIEELDKSRNFVGAKSVSTNLV